MRFHAYSKSFADTREPSDHFAFSSILKTYFKPSSDTLQLFAAAGRTASVFVSAQTSPSKSPHRILYSPLPVVSDGSRLDGSAALPISNVPFSAAVSAGVLRGEHAAQKNDAATAQTAENAKNFPPRIFMV